MEIMKSARTAELVASGGQLPGHCPAASCRTCSGTTIPLIPLPLPLLNVDLHEYSRLADRLYTAWGNA